MSDFTTTLTGTINRTCQESITHPFIDQLSSGKLPHVDGSLKMYENGNLKLYIFVHFFVYSLKKLEVMYT